MQVFQAHDEADQVLGPLGQNGISRAALSWILSLLSGTGTYKMGRLFVPHIHLGLAAEWTRTLPFTHIQGWLCRVDGVPCPTPGEL